MEDTDGQSIEQRPVDGDPLMVAFYTALRLFYLRVNGKFTSRTKMTLIDYFTYFWVYFRDQTREQPISNLS